MTVIIISFVFVSLLFWFDVKDSNSRLNPKEVKGFATDDGVFYYTATNRKD